MPEEESKATPEKPWQKVEWGKQSGFGYLLVSMKPHKKEIWALSLTLPPDADPKDFRINYVESDYGPNRRHTDKFIVDYKVLGQEIRKLIVVPLTSGDRRIDKNHFSVHTQAEIEKFTV